MIKTSRRSKVKNIKKYAFNEFSFFFLLGGIEKNLFMNVEGLLKTFQNIKPPP